MIADLVKEHGPVPYELPPDSVPEANAYAMLASWREVARLVGWSDDAIRAVMDEATSSSYTNLRRVLASCCWEDE